MQVSYREDTDNSYVLFGEDEYVSLHNTQLDEEYTLDSDDNGAYVELCFTEDMNKIILSEEDNLMM